MTETFHKNHHVPNANQNPSRKALEAELKLFCSKYGLTPRESDIFSILVQGVVRIKDVAQRLNLSPNTINNHVNSIFTKTKTSSKSQLLAEFLHQVTDELERARYFRKTPRVLALSNGSGDFSMLSADLIAKGFRVTTVSSTSDLFSHAAYFSPRFIVVDLALVAEPVDQFVRRAQTEVHSASEIVLIGKRADLKNRAHAMHLGAMDLIEPPINVLQLYQDLMCRYIEDESDRARFLGDSGNVVRCAEESLLVRGDQIGAGGLAVATCELDRVLKTSAQTGDFVELRLKLLFEEMARGGDSSQNQLRQAKGINPNEDSFMTRGQIVWRHDGSDSETGVRFVHMPNRQRELIENFTSSHGVNCYIPYRHGFTD